MATVAATALSWLALLPAPYHDWTVDTHMPLPSGPVTVIDSPCPYFDGAAYGCAKGRTIWSPAVNGRSVYLHELGHVYDTAELTWRERRRFKRAIGWAGPWRDYSRPLWLRASELFAATWQRCAEGDPRPLVTYGRTVPLMCELVAGFGRQPARVVAGSTKQRRRQ